MNRLLHLAKAVCLLWLLSSCKKEAQQPAMLELFTVTFVTGTPQLSTEEVLLSVNHAIILYRQEGRDKLEQLHLPVSYRNGYLITDKALFHLNIYPARITIESFVFYNDRQIPIAAVPRKDQAHPLPDWVSHPLPITITLQAEQVMQVPVTVVLINPDTAPGFGYVSLSFHELEYKLLYVKICRALNGQLNTMHLLAGELTVMDGKNRPLLLIKSNGITPVLLPAEKGSQPLWFSFKPNSVSKGYYQAVFNLSNPALSNESFITLALLKEKNALLQEPTLFRQNDIICLAYYQP